MLTNEDIIFVLVFLGIVVPLMILHMKQKIKELKCMIDKKRGERYGNCKNRMA